MSILEEKFTWRRPETERRRPPQALSQDERDNVRRGLRTLLAKYGRAGLAKRMGLTYEGMRKTLKRAPTRRVAVLVSFVARVEVADLLAGAWPCVCPTCGRSE